MHPPVTVVEEPPRQQSSAGSKRTLRPIPSRHSLTPIQCHSRSHTNTLQHPYNRRHHAFGSPEGVPVMSDAFSLECARARDAADPLAHFRDRFHLSAEHDLHGWQFARPDGEGFRKHAILTALDQWKTMGIDGWMSAEPSHGSPLANNWAS